MRSNAYANTVMAESLSRLSGVGRVLIAGEQQPAFHVQVNPEALAERGIGLPQVQTALANATLDAAKGNLEGQRQEFALDTNDQFLNARSDPPCHPGLSERRAGRGEGRRRRRQFLASAAHRRVVRR